MKILNLTNHDIILENEDMFSIFKPSGIVVRVEQFSEQVGSVAGFPLVKSKGNKLVFNGLLPEADFYITSFQALDACEGTEFEGKFICPDTSGAKRDNNGNIISVSQFKTKFISYRRMNTKI